MSLQPPLTFLLGPARSGTSLLYRCLCLHPDLTYVSNYVRRAPQVPELALLNRVPRSLPVRVQRAAWFGEDSNAYVYGSRRRTLERWMPAPVEGEPVFQRSGMTQYADETALPEAEQVLRLRRAFSRLRRADGRRPVVSKRIAHNRRIGTLHRAFPTGRFVSLVRDGRAVASSLSKVDWWLDDRVWWYGGTPREWAAAGGDPWEICARNWVEEVLAVRAGLVEVPDEQVLSLRYEDFVAAPRETLAEVAGFMGLDARSKGWAARLAGLEFPDRNDSWRRSLGEADVRTVERWQGPLLEELGYAADRHAETA